MALLVGKKEGSPKRKSVGVVRGMGEGGEPPYPPTSPGEESREQQEQDQN